MLIVIGGSSSKSIFGALVRWYSSKPYGHIYTRYEEPFTKKMLIAESSHGEHHYMLIDKWYSRGNRIECEYAIDCSEEVFRAILIRNLQLLQASYSVKNILGALIYDLHEALKWKWLVRLAYKFVDGDKSTMCSESASFTLAMLGVKFNRPLDFVKPNNVIEALEHLAVTTDYVRRV
jgi:hypothetical protein